jgi:hypothetical protein
MNGEKRNAFKVLVGELEGERPLEKPRHRQGKVVPVLN